MAWLAVDSDESECIYDIKPTRGETAWEGGYYIFLRIGDIEKLTGCKLTWKDEPIDHGGL